MQHLTLGQKALILSNEMRLRRELERLAEMAAAVEASGDCSAEYNHELDLKQPVY